MKVDLRILLQLLEQALGKSFASLVRVGISEGEVDMLLVRKLVLKYYLNLLRAAIAAVVRNYWGGDPLVLRHRVGFVYWTVQVKLLALSL